MKQRTQMLLLATLASATVWSQEVSVTSTTVAQYWKQEVPGFDKNTLAPATQFLGVDATNLGSEALSMHLYGWGMVDLADSSLLNGKKSDGYLTYGYLQYRFAQANAEVKAGRFTVNQGLAIEQVDGVSARTDLRGGFTFSVFGGRPVRYRTADPGSQSDYEFQSDFLFGSRLSTRVFKFGEVGLSFLQDGMTPDRHLDASTPADYTRKQVGLDLRLSPFAMLDFTGRSVYDVASHPDQPAGQDQKPSRIAEHDYTATVKVAPTLTLTGNFTERNFQAYFAGTNLPSLFNQIERDAHRAYQGSVIWGSPTAFQVVADFRHTHRDTYGDANRFGGELRWASSDRKLLSGFGYHRVSADDVLMVGAIVPSYSLSHEEVRGWVMYEAGALFASLDGIFQTFDDKANVDLNGHTSIYQVVASAGIKAAENLKFSGDISYGANPFFSKELRGLLRAEYRFGSAGKGGGR